MRRAVILAGGLGTRLRPYTTILPKPLMPVGDRPILDIVIRQLARARFERVTIATGYLAELIEAFFGDGSRYGIPIDYFREHEPLGTVGALALIDGLGDEDLLVMNGDLVKERTRDSPFNASTRIGWQSPDDRAAVVPTLASPKSKTFACPRLVTKIFAGLMSR